MAGLKEYKVYVLGMDGHIFDRIDIACENEEAAKERAKQLVDGQAVELWEGARRIARFKPHRAA